MTPTPAPVPGRHRTRSFPTTRPVLNLFNRCVPSLTGTTCDVVADLVAQYERLDIWMTDCAALYPLFVLFVYVEVQRRAIPGPLESISLPPIDIVYRGLRSALCHPAPPGHTLCRFISEIFLILPIGTTLAWIAVAFIAGVDVAFNLFLIQLYLKGEDLGRNEGWGRTGRDGMDMQCSGPRG